jgi:hypothetical protein
MALVDLRLMKIGLVQLATVVKIMVAVTKMRIVATLIVIESLVIVQEQKYQMMGHAE